ncbi:hypothetical protein SAMN05216464_11795 [Mucilaginibacter pineti]|uniref:Nucleotide-binding universal stress protein, UspA family n=1 Tax=Mucilaginibacter pineti TaxID=1391627 RepID=A0A1G7KUW2_9SPHI|nr:hypothetical protein [Mucilaginibacter pineti]SDF41013.1 hypothetical protein SAMN05216464_11795 [Mucilaginibacter pineti]
MKTLLIPTDFTQQSIQSIPVLARQYYPQQINIVLVHMLKITDNISELLMLSRRSVEYRHIPDNFYKRCTELERKHSHLINKIAITFFYGSTVAVFNNFLEANEVDAIVMPHDNYQLLFKNSIDPEILIGKSKIEVIAKPETQGIMADIVIEDFELTEEHH